MKPLLLILGALPLLAQQAATTPAPATAPAAAPATTTADAPSPAPPTEPVLTGWIDLGYRWGTGVGGSFDTYRSIINLGSGPKFLGADFTLTDPKHKWFDTIQVRADSWGDEPSSSVHVEAKKSGVYVFNADYRDFAYFDFLPSYADPLLSQGIVLDEQSFDTRRKIAALSLDIRPGHWWTPYFGWDHDSSSGSGATVFVTDGNNYPVPNTLSDSTELYRAGVRFEKPHFHLTLEEGGTTFKSDQNLYQNPQGSVNSGNFSTPILGQTLDLTNLLAAYGIGGSSAYTKALLTASPTTWLDIYGQFLYSQPDSRVNYEQTSAGNLYLQSQVLFYSSEQEVITAASQQPHTSGSFGAEIRPLKRMRIVESWLTDRLHDAGSSASTQTLMLSGASMPLSSLLATMLASNYSQEAIDIFYDANSKLTLRGGYRYVWGDSSYAFLPPEGLASSAQGQLRQNIGLGAATFRPTQKISVTGEFEGGSSSGVYFRTSLYNYERVRAQVHYQPLQSLSISGAFTLLDNQNPLAGTNYAYSSYQESLSFYWSPHGKIFDIQGSYTRSTLRSNIEYLDPGTLTPQLSNYRDDAHTATALFDLTWPHSKHFAPKLAAGGSFFISSGSQPTSYYQPTAKLWVPLGKHATWFSEWRYYGYGEAFLLYQGFRTHLVTTGVRFTR
jgi:hypothetical protein